MLSSFSSCDYSEGDLISLSDTTTTEESTEIEQVATTDVKECPICQDDILIDPMIKYYKITHLGERKPLNDSPAVTPCGHTFHYECLVTWLEKSRMCPVCKASVNKRSLMIGFPG